MDTVKLAKAQYSFWDVGTGSGRITGNWSPSEVDKLESLSIKEYQKIVDQCRFYYRKDPIAGTVLNKMVEIGITNIVLDQGNLSQNEFKIFESMQPKIQQFIEDCGLEYLISGLLIPEVRYTSFTKKQLTDLGIKKYTSLTLPETMWLRDPKTIKINSTMVADKPSYYVILPEEIIFFILHEGTYPDGNKDIELYQLLVEIYPEFVLQVKSGNKEILLDNEMVVRRKVLSDSPYPTPYLYNAIEALKHKRNLRRMDYSIASRVIGAIMLVKVGNDEYPVTEDEEDAFTAIRNQMTWRNSYNKDLERIFQLFVNHTVEIEWVNPPVEALLSDSKYKEVNQDIFFALGFPRILTTGETEKTQTSDPEFASMSPVKSMEAMQRQLLPIVDWILKDIAESNGFKNHPKPRFSNINLHAFTDFVSAMTSLYNSGNISRTSYAQAFGYNWEEEMAQKEDEQKLMDEMDLPEFSQLPFSNQPGQPGQNQLQKPEKKEEKKEEKPKKEPKED
jgi:hypothetical protein